jgi:hypothetical protein
MIAFDKPSNLNGSELLNEIRQNGIVIEDLPFDDGSGKIYLNIDKKDAEKVKSIVNQHNGTVIPKDLTVEEKLSSVGLSVNELKSLLGLVNG